MSEYNNTLSPTGPGAPATVGSGGSRIWLYPDRRPGPSARKRRNIAIVLIAIYLLTPYLTISGRPLLRFDVLSTHISVAGLTFHYTDAGFVFFVLGILATTLFFVTALWGRIWCGYACPQTVFIDWVIRPVEQLWEGDHLQRRRRDQNPWVLENIGRRLGKYLTFFVIAAIIANTFLAYFVAPETLWHWITQPPARHPFAFGVMSFVLLGFYFDLGWFREQFCCFLCPYARFQSILIDRSTPCVGYDSKRGEPRGKGEAKGDCIDCGLCTRVCPTGIDIRQGLQLECIACERCIDACDSIMTNIKRPTGLIRMLSVAERDGEKPQSALRPRVLVYGALVLIFIAGLTVALLQRQDVSLTLIRTPRQAFAKLDDLNYSNMFQIKVSNNTSTNKVMRLKVLTPIGATLICGGCAADVKPWDEQLLNVSIIFRQDQVRESKEVKLQFEATGEILSAKLIAP